MRPCEHQDAQRGSSGGGEAPWGGRLTWQGPAVLSLRVRVPRVQRADSVEASESERRVACCQAMRDGWLVP